MGRFVPLAVRALGALHVLGAVAQIPPCITPCSDQLRSEFAKFSCGSATDAACLCPKADFSFGIRDCAKSCGANDENVRQFLAASGAFCTGLLPPAPAPTNSQAPTTTNAQTTPTQAAQTTAPATNSAASVTTQGTLTPTPNSNASPSVTGHRSTTSASAKSSNVASPTSSTSTSDDPAGPTSSEAAASESGSGLSKGSVVGISVGVGASVIVLAAIFIGLLFRSRKRKPRQSMEISKPLPGSGRTYGGRDRGSFEKYGNDIEMTSNRYEDMVPRQQPRTMV